MTNFPSLDHVSQISVVMKWIVMIKKITVKRKASKTPIKSDEKLKKATLVTDWYDKVVEESVD